MLVIPILEQNLKIFIFSWQKKQANKNTAVCITKDKGHFFCYTSKYFLCGISDWESTLTDVVGGMFKGSEL